MPGKISEQAVKILPEAFGNLVAVINAEPEIILPVPGMIFKNKAAISAVIALNGVILPGIPDQVHDIFLEVLRQRRTSSGFHVSMAECISFPG